MIDPMEPVFTITQACHNALQEECDGRMVIIRRLEVGLAEAKVEIARLDAVIEEYEAIGDRVVAQNGNWLFLHAGAIDWLHQEFKQLKEAR